MTPLSRGNVEALNDIARLSGGLAATDDKNLAAPYRGGKVAAWATHRRERLGMQKPSSMTTGARKTGDGSSKDLKS